MAVQFARQAQGGGLSWRARGRAKRKPLKFCAPQTLRGRSNSQPKV